MTRQRLGWLLVAGQGVLLVGIVVMPRRPPTVLSLAIGVPLVSAGIVLGLVAARRLGSALTPTPVPLAGAGLRTDGAYRYVRHPIYAALLLAATGYVVALGSWWSAAWAVALLLFFVIKSRWEDSLLHAEYGPAWEEWARRTGALLPRISRRP